ncbi:hypothetical protein CEE37_04305 [candidate division LCP-89 bacterium B3_LCP]|uniref:Uncharacterized protein n=1 Tax=candidate division LCP-89 bacterium B3_LCP TaxID=2012998 RepID=A0A532V475_UNCL8|nr:MAG: hypothetical protein CEE37_04305 [candidate division LCP-89 bacterium B3_LCP]
MKNNSKNEMMKSHLMSYLDIATKFRNHEFNIQMLRNVVFTGVQTVLLACYAATIGKHTESSLAIACFGILMSSIWFFYYRSSLYWGRYWEFRCRQVNDKAVKELGLGINIFKGHPVGKKQNKIPSIMHGGRIYKPRDVHGVLLSVPIFSGFLWIILAAVIVYLFLNGEPIHLGVII